LVCDLPNDKETDVNLKLLAREIKDGVWEDLMSSAGTSDVLKMSVGEIHARLAESCGLEGGAVVSGSWFDIYWTAGWVKAMLAAQVPLAATVLEIGAGLSVNFVRAAASLLGSRGRFVAVNLNKNLSDSFQRRNRQLPIRMQFIEGNARDIHRHLPEASCSFIAFNHQIDDILQTMVFESHGRRTEEGDWCAMAPEMVRLTLRAHESGAIDETIRPQFLELIRSCSQVLQPGRVMGFNNAVTPLLLRLGYTEELLGSYIPMARRWIEKGVPSLQEQIVEGFDRKWWMFLRKI
jgi:hypothetical protein